MKRKHAVVGALGLGGYASDEDEDETGSQEAEEAAEDQSQEEHGQGVLLPHYRSKESLDADELEGLHDGGDQQDEERRRSPLTAGTSSGDGDEEGRSGGGPDPANPLSRLPPELRDPLPTECSEALQAKFAQYVATLRGRGISLTDSIMQRKAFRNPDFLQKLVEHFNIKELGSAFPPDVFAPDDLPAEDTIEGLLRALEREQERRMRAREAQVAAGTARIDFSKGAGPLGHIPASNSASNLLMAQQAAAVAAAAVARVVGKR